MANFRTHLIGATLVSGAAVTATIAVELAPIDQSPTLMGLGMAGGILPDIDADNSTPVRLAFSLLGLICAFLAIFYALEHFRFSIGELFVLGLGAFLLIRYGIFEFFLRLTEHRGVFHSLLAVACFTLAGASASFNLFSFPPQLAWLHGLLLGMGYLTHLILDELFSVDLSNSRLKRSFGTALKLFHYRDLKASLLMGMVTLGLTATTPDPGLLTNLVSENRMFAPIREHFWPSEGRWFADLWQRTPRARQELGLIDR
ncbi:MAG: metal-dependent hydrolase [Methylohalobius sp. ZOD2]|nr:metal-dependent hydrolase [Methylothermaceae bacterium]